MPSGRTHDRITLLALPVVSVLSLHYSQSLWQSAVVSAGFVFGGLMFGPDLDIHSVQYKRWGCFRWIWLPYRQRLLHRSLFSHGPIVGTTIRVLYVSVWLGVLTVLVAAGLNSIFQSAITWADLRDSTYKLLRNHWRLWLFWLVGIELGALSHSVSDWLVSSHKRALRRNRPHRYRRRRRRK